MKRSRIAPVLVLVVAGVCHCRGAGSGEDFALTLSVSASPTAGPVTMSASTSDDDATVRVDFFFQGSETAFDSDIIAPFSSIVGSDIGDGVYAVVAVATHRDGRETSDSVSFVLDTSPPVVAVSAPVNDDRVLPPGDVFVSLVAEDLAGVSGGTVTVLDESQALSSELTAVVRLPSTAEFPVRHELGWAVEDVLGHQSRGSVPVVLTRERLSVPLATAGIPYPLGLSDGRILVASGWALSSLDPGGQEEWRFDLPVGTFLRDVHEAGDGEALLLMGLQDLPGLVEVWRLCRDGNLRWMLPGEGHAFVDVIHDPVSDEIIASQVDYRRMDAQTGAVMRVDRDGVATNLMALEQDEVVFQMRQCAGCLDGSIIALWIVDSAGVQADRVAMVTSSGEALSSLVMPLGLPVHGLFPVDLELVMLVVREPEDPFVSVLALGPRGVLFAVEPQQGETLTHGLAKSDGDFLLRSELIPTGGRVRSYRPDGTLRFEENTTERIQSWAILGNDVVVAEGTSLGRLTPDGQWAWTFSLPRTSTTWSNEAVSSILVNEDGSVFVQSARAGTIFIRLLDATGNSVWRQQLDGVNPTVLRPLPHDGGVMFMGPVGISEDLELLSDLHAFVR